MKLMPALIGTLLAGLLLTACAAPAPRTAPAPAATREETANVPPGAYRRIGQDNPDAVTASRFAVSEQSRVDAEKLSLLKVVAAEQQVVAGVNFRLCLNIGTPEGARTAVAVVYRNLSQEYSLSLWAWLDCP